MKILILPRYTESGASSRCRSYNYKPFFKNKINCVYSPLFGGRYIHALYGKNFILRKIYQLAGVINRFWILIFYARQYDLLIIEKELLPYFPYFIEKMLLKGKVYSLDYDDYVGANYQTNSFLSNKINQLVNGASGVTVGNKWYFEEFKSNNLHYLPTVIDLEKYPETKKQFAVKKKAIVWIGSPSTEKYLEILIPVLQQLAQKHHFVLKIIGSTIEIKGVDVVYVQWKEATEVSELMSSDIGIMPLENLLWEKGKCGFKLIQYMACGLPVIGSPSPANEEIVENGVQGYIAKSEQEWHDYLIKLLADDGNLCSRMGAEGRKRIVAAYNYQVWGDRYVDMITNFARNKG